jgi:serine protease
MSTSRQDQKTERPQNARLKSLCKLTWVLTAAVSAQAYGQTLTQADDRIGIEALNAQTQTTRFIVGYREVPTKSHAKDGRKTRLGNAVAQAFGRGKALAARSIDTMGTGDVLVEVDRALDRVEAERLMRQIAEDPSVDYVFPDARVQAAYTPNDQYYYLQYNLLSQIGGTRTNVAWDTGFRGQGKIVAVIDTGITSHPDLSANVLPGYDFISDLFTANDGNGRDANAADPGDWVAAGQCGSGSGAQDSTWHGTHVAGIVAAVADNKIGIAGMAPRAKILPVRALGRCGGWWSDVIDAITWASGGAVTGVPAVGARKAHVINLSLGAKQACWPGLQKAINGAVARGTTVVAAAGNANVNVSGYAPAGCANLISVAATDSKGARAAFSNFGAGVDVAAPGVWVLSAMNAGLKGPTAANYVYLNGTSMAAPHVAALVAMMQSKPAIDRTPAQVEALIKSKTKPFGVVPAGKPSGTDIIDARKALDATP